MALLLELNIALIPEHQLAKQQIELSQELARENPAIVQLGGADAKLAIAPHLTLYQIPLLVAGLPAIDTALNIIATKYPVQELACTGYVYNSGEGSFEASYQTVDWLAAFQNEIIAKLNPLRGDLLLERDPAGNKLDRTVLTPSIAGKNISQTGYAEVGELFRPHVTINWFELGTHFDVSTNRLPSPEMMSGRFVALGVYLLGPYGTCPQRVMKYMLQ